MEGAYLLAQQCSGRRGGRQGLLRGPVAGLLNLVLDKVLQGSELHLAAAASVHVILICNESHVRGTGGSQGLIPRPSRLRQEIPKDGTKTRADLSTDPKAAEDILEYIQGWGTLRSNLIFERSTEARPIRETSILHRLP